MQLVWWTSAFVAAMAVAIVAGAGGGAGDPSSSPRFWLTAVAAGALGILAAAMTFVAAVAQRRRRGGARDRPATIARAARAAALVASIAAVASLGATLGFRAGGPAVLAPALAAAADGERRVVLGGRVVGGPDPVREGSRLRVAVDRVDGQAVAPAVIAAVAVAAGVPDVLPGDRVELAARLGAVRGLANPGVADWSRSARADGIDLFAGVGAASAIERRGPAGRQAPVMRAAVRARAALGRAIDGAVTGPAAALLHTAVLGERREIAPAVEDGFRAAGATHVLSVSGLHLAAVTALFFVVVRRALGAVPLLPLWVQPRALAALASLAAVAFYTLCTGAAVATVRSALMAGVALVGVAIGRPSTPIVAIAAAVAVLAGSAPLVLFDVSFQLSVISVLALALLVRRLAPGGAPAGGVARSRLGRWLVALGRWTARFAAATVAAGVATAPLVAHHFGEITPAAPLGNLALVPLVELVVVPCGLGGAALGALAGPAWGLVPLTIAGVGARVALAVAALFRAVAPVWLCRAPDALETAALMAGGVAALAALPRRAPRRRMTAVAAALLLVVAGGSMGARELERRLGDDLVVTFLDVGQGDAAVVELPGGRALLIDGGGTYDGAFDPGERVVEPFLRARGITSLDVVALSHPHPDHLGGLHRVVARFAVRELWTSGDDGRNPDYGRLVAEASARGVAAPVPARRQAAGGGVVIEPLGPFVSDAGGGERVGAPDGVSVNDASLVVRIAYGGRAVLFTGDIEADGEGELAGRLAVGQEVAADVLKVPHHGSRTSSSDELLDAARPRLAVMSLGWQNRFHFPRAEVLDRYARRGIRVLRTDLDGAVTVTIGAAGALRVECARGCGAGQGSVMDQ